MQVVTALGRTWHPEHFVCSHCRQELGTQNFFERDGQPYCEPDYHHLFSPRCAYCNGPILDVRPWFDRHANRFPASLFLFLFFPYWVGKCWSFVRLLGEEKRATSFSPSFLNCINRSLSAERTERAIARGHVRWRMKQNEWMDYGVRQLLVRFALLAAGFHVPIFLNFCFCFFCYFGMFLLLSSFFFVFENLSLSSPFNRNAWLRWIRRGIRITFSAPNAAANSARMASRRRMESPTVKRTTFPCLLSSAKVAIRPSPRVTFRPSTDSGIPIVSSAG